MLKTVEKQSMIRDEQLYQAFKVWLEAALKILRTKPMPVYEDIEVTYTAYGWQTQGGHFKPDYGRQISMCRNELLSLAETHTVLNIVANSPMLASVLLVDLQGNPIVELERQEQVFTMFTLDKFLLAYLTSISSTDSIPTAFERIYHQLELYVTEASFDCVCSVHLYNLNAELDTILLERGISLRQTTQGEKVNAIRNVQSSSIIDVPRVFLEIHRPIGRTSQPDQQEAMNTAQAVVLMLRLLKANPIGTASYQWSTPEQPFKWVMQAAYAPIVHPSSAIGEPYVLTQQDAQILPRLWRKTKKAHTKTNLATAITRFEDSYSRTKPEDKLIDYWTALEALFFSDDEFRDMGKSLALAASYYLGRTESERTSIYNDLTRSHTLRSHFIHGERGKTKVDLNEMVTKTGKHLRRALRQHIEE